MAESDSPRLIRRLFRAAAWMSVVVAIGCGLGGSHRSGSPARVRDGITLDPIPRVVCGGSVTVSGKAKPGMRVGVAMAKGGRPEHVATADDSGTFCMSVPIRRVQSLFVSGRLGVDTEETQRFTVEDNCAPVSPYGPAGNIAGHAELISWNNAVARTELIPLTDGDLATAAVLPKGRLSLSFKEAVEVDEVKLTWRDDRTSATKEYGVRYQLLWSAGHDPGVPGPGGLWTTAYDEQAGTGGVRRSRLGNTMIKHVGLLLEGDGVAVPGVDEVFAISEIEIHATGRAIAPAPPEDCSVLYPPPSAP